MKKTGKIGLIVILLFVMVGKGISADEIDLDEKENYSLVSEYASDENGKANEEGLREPTAEEIAAMEAYNEFRLKELSKDISITPFSYVWKSKSIPFSVASHGQTQVTGTHCAQASARAVIKYLSGKSISQWTLATDMNKAPNTGTAYSSVHPAINKYTNAGYGWSNINTANRSFKTIVEQSINKNRPVIAYTGLPELDPTYYGPEWNSAHYVVIIGYKFWGPGGIIASSSSVSPMSNTPTSGETVTYYDPYRNKIITTSSSIFINSMRACRESNQVLIW